jgi:hypothetical protein
MKVIKNILLLIIAIQFISCEKEDDKRFTQENQSFVRFFLLVASNNEVLEFPEKDGNLVAASSYAKDNLKTLKIPVAITAAKINNPVTISFSTSVIGLSNYTITPENSLTFTNEKRIDTIYIKVNKNWDLTKNPQIKLTLTESSNTAVFIGIPNENIPNNELNISFKETVFPYFFNINRKEIEGINQESFDFKVLFPNGFIASEIENIPLFSAPSTFKYTIEKKPITKEDEVEFTFKVNENLAEDSSLDTSLSLVEIPNYVKGINNFLDINKPIKVDRDGVPVINFYNLNDPFYRLFGEYWRPDNDIPGSCEWFSTSVFPKPVIVDKDHKNGFLFSDNGTPNDASDDVYHHRYKLGFVGNFAPIGTNPFAIKNLFEGERNDSPGLTLPEAIEFFPKNGNSTSEGIVNVISQRIIIVRSSDLKAFTLPISGSGIYELVDSSSNLWKITLEVYVDATSINGEIVKRDYILYNNRNYPDPDPLTTNCPTVISL